MLGSAEKMLDKGMAFRELTKFNPAFLMEALELLGKVRHVLKYTVRLPSAPLASRLVVRVRLLPGQGGAVPVAV